MSFDPYWAWLQIPDRGQPPNYYELFGLTTLEPDVERIRAAAMDRIALVRKYQIGQQADDAIRLLGEMSRAFDCLTDADRKRAYDQRISGQQTVVAAPTTTVSDVPAPPSRPAPVALPKTTLLEPVISPLAGSKSAALKPVADPHLPAVPQPTGLAVVKQTPAEAARTAAASRTETKPRGAQRAVKIRPARLQLLTRQRWIPFAVAALLLVGLGGIAHALRVHTPAGVIVLNISEPNAEVLVDGQKIAVKWGADGKSAEISVPPGKHTIRVKKPGFVVSGKEIALADGTRQVLSFVLEVYDQRAIAQLRERLSSTTWEWPEVFALVNENSGRCLTVVGGSKHAGTEVVQGPLAAGAGPAERWRAVKAGDAYKIVNINSGKVLAVPQGSRKNGVKIIQWNDRDDGDVLEQRWEFVKRGNHYVLKSRCSGLLLAVSAGAKQAQAPVIQWQPTEGAEQRWSVQSVPDAGTK